MPTWGRGGAGNIVTDAQVEETRKRLGEDLEAQQTLTSAAAPPGTSSAPPPEYAHSGRGGAGNWFQPSVLSQEGTFTSTTATSATDNANGTNDATALPTSARPNISTPWHPDNQEMPVARAGRGGAGNFVWKSEQEKREEEEKKRVREEKLKEGVERSVEEGLAKPPGVVVAKDGVLGGRGW